MLSKGLAIVSVTLSAPASPKPVTGISQGSPFAPAQGADGPATLMDMFAGLLGGGQADQATAPMTQSTTLGQSSELTLPIPALPAIATGEAFDSARAASSLAAGAEDAVRVRPDNLIAQIARALSERAQGGGKPDQGPDLTTLPAGSVDIASLTLADPDTAPVEAEASDKDETVLDPAGLFAQLLDMLTALQQTLADGNAVDPATRKKLDEALAALAQAMGMPVGDLQKMLAPQLALPGATADASDGVAGAAPAPAGNPAQPAAEIPAGADGAARPVVPANDLEALTERLNALARTLAPSDPALADKLRTLAGNIEAADPDLLAKLGFSAELKLAGKDGDAALDRLLAAKLPDQPTQPSGPKLAEASLDLPEIAKPDGAAKPAPAEAAVKAEAAKPEAPRPEPARPEVTTRHQPVETARADEPARQRSEPGPAPTAAPGADKTADPAQSNANAAAVPPTRADGLVAGARAVHAAYQTPHTQVNLPQLAYEIVRHAGEGHNRFQIRLDPADLGRIDVRMEIDNKGTLNARMTVERPETLDLLQRDQRALEKALAQAGLDSAKTNLEFSLRQNPFARQDTDQGQQRGGFQFEAGAENQRAAEEPAATVSTTLYRGAATASGVNLFV